MSIAGSERPNRNRAGISSSQVSSGRCTQLDMSLGRSDRRKELKVPTWANRPSGLGQTPGNLYNMRVQFYGISAEEYPDALADAVFQLEVEIAGGYLLN